MNNRRSLSQALGMTPQKIAFIKGGPLSTAERSVTQSSPPEKAEPHADQEAGILVDPESSSPDQKPRPRREKPVQVKTTAPTMLTTPVVSITTRLTQATAEALRRASLQRKLVGAIPSSQQEIVECAVSAWLKDNGFKT